VTAIWRAGSDRPAAPPAFFLKQGEAAETESACALPQHLRGPGIIPRLRFLAMGAHGTPAQGNTTPHVDVLAPVLITTILLRGS
jgi:hypothetical protein